MLLLGLAQGASTGDKLCVPALAKLKLPMDFLRWFGCTLGMHESLAGGLIGISARVTRFVDFLKEHFSPTPPWR